MPACKENRSFHLLHAADWQTHPKQTEHTMANWIKENYSFQDLQRIISRLLEKVDIFSGLTQQELLILLEAAGKCTFEPGDYIVHEGRSGSFLYVIIDGEVSVLKSAASGNKELATLKSGDSFGEMSLVDQLTRSASVVAVTHCVLLRLSENECWRHPVSSAKIYRNIARILSRRLRDMDDVFVLGRIE